MLRRLFRWVTVPAATLVLSLGSVGTAPPATAAGSCSLPIPMTSVAAGAFTDEFGEDYWRYDLAGTTTFRLTDLSVYMYVYTYSNGCGTLLCSTGSTCTVTHSGPVVIAVYPNSANSVYVLTATTTPASTATCNRLNTAGVCVDITTGAIVQSQTVYNVAPIVTATHTADGWLDAYRFPLPTGGSLVLPCVTLKVNTTTANPCTTAGGTFVSRTATLVAQSVNQPGVTQGLPLTTVRVCEALYTVTVSGFGAEDVPAYSTC